MKASRIQRIRLILAWALLMVGPSSSRAAALAGGDLVGTIVLEGGGSYALFGDAGKVWRVHQGGELPDGSRLVEVKNDGIVVESSGARREFQLFARQTRHTAPSASEPVTKAVPSPSVEIQANTPATEVGQAADYRVLRPGALGTFSARSERRKQREARSAALDE